MVPKKQPVFVGSADLEGLMPFFRTLRNQDIVGIDSHNGDPIGRSAFSEQMVVDDHKPFVGFRAPHQGLKLDPGVAAVGFVPFFRRRRRWPGRLDDFPGKNAGRLCLHRFAMGSRCRGLMSGLGRLGRRSLCHRGRGSFSNYLLRGLNRGRRFRRHFGPRRGSRSGSRGRAQQRTPFFPEPATVPAALPGESAKEYFLASQGPEVAPGRRQAGKNRGVGTAKKAQCRQTESLRHPGAATTAAEPSDRVIVWEAAPAREALRLALWRTRVPLFSVLPESNSMLVYLSRLKDRHHPFNASSSLGISNVSSSL